MGGPMFLPNEPARFVQLLLALGPFAQQLFWLSTNPDLAGWQQVTLDVTRQMQNVLQTHNALIAQNAHLQTVQPPE